MLLRLPRPMVAAALVLVALGVASPSHAAERRFALVIGYNGSDDPGLASLKYADDDALRYRDVLRHVADEVVVLTEVDGETRRLLGKHSGPAPTRGAVVSALANLRKRLAAARAAGDRPILYVVYSGHGNYDAAGRGYVHLKGGRFTTRDFYDHVFGANGDDPVVLVLDACNAALLVASRGGAQRRAARPTKLNLESYPNVGVILSSSSVGETHEWGRYLAGVFSHEVRSALVGPADLNGDSKITFAEVAAFIAAANDEVKNPTVRIRAYVRPPLSEPELALVDLRKARFPVRVHVGPELVGKAHVVDPDLVRYADFHKTRGHQFWLALPAPRSYVVVHGGHEYVVPEGASGELKLTDLERRARTVLAARSARSEYFDRTLFHRAYGNDFAQRYLKDNYLSDLEVSRDVEGPWYENPGAWATAGAGLIALAIGAGYHSAAVDAHDRGVTSPWADERARANQALADHQTTAGVLYGVGGAALIGSVLWFILDPPVETERYRPPLRIHAGPGGVSLSADL